MSTVRGPSLRCWPSNSWSRRYRRSCRAYPGVVIAVLTSAIVLCMHNLLCNTRSVYSPQDKPQTIQARAVESSQCDKFVPRGQTYYYSDSESQRLDSFEVWRPPELIECKRRPVRVPEDDNVLIVMQVTSENLWSHAPLQLQSGYRHFSNLFLFSHHANSIAGVEIHDVLKGTHPEMMEHEDAFEAYRVMRAIRERHVSINMDQTSHLGTCRLEKYLLVPALYEAFQKHNDLDWYVVVKDDTTLIDRNLREFLATLDSNKPYYLGKEFKEGSMRYASSHSAIILSHEAMRQAFNIPPTAASSVIYFDYMKRAHRASSGDIHLARFLRDRAGIHLDTRSSGHQFQDLSLNNLQISATNWCSVLASFGSQTPNEIEKISGYTDAKNHTLLYYDIYLDFIKPYLLSGPQEYWDNGAADIEYSPAQNPSAQAHRSLESCRSACERVPQCTMLRYDNYLQYCGLGISSVSLGNPVLGYNSGADDTECKTYGIRCSPRGRGDTLTSQWFIDRIKQMRATLPCDMLHDQPRGEGIEHGALDQVEGWWHRAS